jgi:hypothetical protein
MEAPRLIDINELAARLSLHPVTVRGLHRRKAIPSISIGHRTLRFEYAAVVEALKRANDPSMATQA